MRISCAKTAELIKIQLGCGLVGAQGTMRQVGNLDLSNGREEHLGGSYLEQFTCGTAIK